MIHSLTAKLDDIFGFEQASAHCDIPCKIYDPCTAQVAALSVIRFIDLINELGEKDSLSLAEKAQLSRLVREKEIHAKKVKDEIVVIWGDYFKQPQFEAFPDISQLVHNIMLTGSACKQHISRDKAILLLSLVNEFAEAFWSTKGVAVYTATCPYPPSETVVYPKLA
ncbi:superoxide dismutase, Ni [Paraglaciecola sp. 2405UD69-4]|uniref:superoxide dismutase, Ni n=1 Tax=Paraglaciecola sp. 2405UD69-4 TaxID=3391836 RepID=UPI0039C9E32F